MSEWANPVAIRALDGVAKAKVLWRPQYGGACVVAYDPADPPRSQPAQLRWNGTVLIVTGVFAAVSGMALLAIALS